MKPYTWRAAILKSNLPPTTRHVLLTLSCYVNDVGQSAYPSIKLLAKNTGLSDRAVQTHLHIARDAGWLTVSKHGFGGQNWANNEYMPRLPDVEYEIPAPEKKSDLPPEKVEARKIVAGALLSGALIKSPCACCGNPNSEANHADYSKPLEVVWLCRDCRDDDKKGAEPSSIPSKKVQNLTTEGAAPNDNKVRNDVPTNRPIELSNNNFMHPPTSEAVYKSDNATAKRLPENFVLPKKWGEWALAEFASWTPEHVRSTAEMFKDHWIAASGQNARKRNWFATWRNWCRKAPSPVQQKTNSGLPWYATDATILEKGASLGLHPMAGESMNMFKGRIHSKIELPKNPASDVPLPKPAIVVRSDMPSKVAPSVGNNELSKLAMQEARRILSKTRSDPEACDG